jgi:hypothetical protein
MGCKVGVYPIIEAVQTVEKKVALAVRMLRTCYGVFEYAL